MSDQGFIKNSPHEDAIMIDANAVPDLHCECGWRFPREYQIETRIYEWRIPDRCKHCKKPIVGGARTYRFAPPRLVTDRGVFMGMKG